MDREFDIVIYGVTAYTGYFVARELLLNTQNDANKRVQTLKWAVAGRDVTKMANKLEQLNNEIPFDHLSITKIQADSTNFSSLVDMARRTRIIANVAGPFRDFGRPVIEACIQEQTHHVDISAEFSYFEGCAVDYNELCKKKEVIVISTCGWDVIPVDMGVHYMKQNFNGTLHSVESFAKIHFGPKGYPVNIGTLRSMIYEFTLQRIFERRSIRNRLNKEVYIKELPTSQDTLRWKLYAFTSKHIAGWSMLFPSCDKSVNYRTQRHNFDEFGERPVQLQTYYTVQTLLGLIGVALLMVLMAFFTMFPWTRRLMEKYPNALTFGYMTSVGASREQVDTTTFKTVLVGRGWSEKEPDVTKEPKGRKDKKVVVTVESFEKDPGYKGTATFLIQCALTLLLERDKMPKGGVLTPGYAFHKTSLIDRLQQNGIQYSLKEA